MFKRIGFAFAAVAKVVGLAMPVVLRDAAGLAAVGSVSYGAWLITPPAGFIVGGALVLTGVILVSVKRAAPN